MRQLVVLCLLACIVCSCIAEQTKPQGYDEPDYYEKEDYKYYDKYYQEKDYYDRKDYKDYEKHDKKYEKYDGYDFKAYDEYKNYESHDYYPRNPDEPYCGPDSFPELKPPSCIWPHHADLQPYNKTTCVINTVQWCKKLPNSYGPGKLNFSCTYKYKRPGHVCAPRNGICDEDDVCNGTSAVCPKVYKPSTYQCSEAQGPCDVPDFCPGNGTTCPDKVVPKDVVCRHADKPCIKDSKCDGVVKFCPMKQKYATGTPCNHEGVYDEVHDDYGKVELLSTDTEHKAKKHGWSTCHRCYKGECKQFKWEWWKTEKKHKKHHHEKEEEKDYSDEKDYGENAKDYYGEHEEEEEEYYPTKSDYSVHLEGYEPKFYCKKNEAA